MKLNIIFFIIFIYLILAGCTKEDNPFAPPEDLNSADYEITAIPTAFYINNRNDAGKYAEIITGMQCSSKGKYLAGVEVEAKWWKSSKYLPVLNNPQYFGGYYGYPNQLVETREGDYYNFFYEIDNKHYSYVYRYHVGLYPAVNISSLRIARYEEIFPYRTPVFRIDVSNPTTKFYLSRQYRVRAFDVQGNNTGFKDIEVKFCDAHIKFIRVRKSDKAAIGPVVNDHVALPGNVISGDPDTGCVVEFRIPTDFALSMYDFQFDYYNNNQRQENYMWKVAGIYIKDLEDNKGPQVIFFDAGSGIIIEGVNLISRNVYFSIDKTGDIDTYQLENIRRWF